MKMVNLRPSPNEEARLLKEERERRRKLRIQQVREQSKVNAAKLRESVLQEKDRLLRELKVQLQEDWLREKQAQLEQLEDTYEKTVSGVGDGHRQAIGEQIELQRECRQMLQSEDQLRAQRRHELAIRRQKEEAKQRQIEESKHIIARQAALEAEKARAFRIAALPPPPKDPLDSIEPVKLRPVRYTDRDAFATSHYHISNAVVERASIEEECDARLVAEAEEEKLHDAEMQKRRVEHERTEKAYLRHKLALEKESLKEEYNTLLLELSDLQRADVNRRCRALEQLPKQIFVAPHRMIEEKEEQQHMMEKAFEDLYMTATEFTGDLRLALDARPVSQSPVPSDSLDITSELAEPTPAAIAPSDEHLPTPLPTASVSSDQLPVKLKLDLSKPSTAGEGPLKKLYERIRSQRENWQQRSLHESHEVDVDGSHSEAILHTAVAETDEFPIHINGTIQPGPMTSLRDATPSSVYRGDSRLETIEACEYLAASLSEGTITDSTPGSAVNHHALSLEEGTLMSSVSSYRSIAQRPPGFNTPTGMSDQAAQNKQFTGQPYNLSSEVQEWGDRRSVLAAREDSVFYGIQHQQQIEQERQELENHLSMIESKQRQFEAQERLIAEMLHFRPQSGAEPVTDRLKAADRSHVSDEVARHVSSTQHSSIHPSSSVTKAVSHVPSSSYSKTIAKEMVQSAESVYSKAGVESSLPLVVGRDKVLADREVGSNVRQYQEELLRRQTDRQHALLEARRRLQMRAEQLLDSGMNLLSESPNNKRRSVSHSQSLTALSEQSHAHEAESQGVSRLSESDVLHGSSRDMVETQVEVLKPYRPELYQPKSLTEDVEAFESTAAAAASHGDGDGTDDERQFVTPELKEDSRIRPYRVAEYSSSPSPHASDAAHRSEQLSMPTGHGITQSNSDEFNSLIQQAQRELEVRQRQMQDQLEALENEERRLAEHQLQIHSQIGSFPSKIQASMTDTSHSQQPIAVLDSYISSDLLDVASGASPSLSVQNTPVVGYNNVSHSLSSANKENLDISGLRSDLKGKMDVENMSPRTDSHQILLSHSAPLLPSQNDSSIHSEQLPPAQFVDGIIRSHSTGSTALNQSGNIEGSFRTLSLLNAANDNSTQCGDYGRQVEISPAAQVGSQLQQSFGDRGDAHHVSEDTPHELKSTAGMPKLPGENGSSSLDTGSSVKPVQPQEENGNSAAVSSRSKYESGDADQTMSGVTVLGQTTPNVLPTSVLSTDKRLNWETLFMPYRRNNSAQQTLQPMPVTVSTENRSQAPAYLATLYEGFSETCDLRQHSEDNIARPDSTSMENTSIWRISDNETGITDEPDLTLVSGVTSTDVSVLSPEKSIVTTPGRSTSGSSSLLSFEQHERSLLDSSTPQTLRKLPQSGSPSGDGDSSKYHVKAGKDAKSVGVRFLLPTEDTLQSRPVDVMPDQVQSLQDAFAAKRPEFVHKSEQRLADAREKAKKVSEKRIEELGQTIASWKKARSLNIKPGSLEKEARWSATPNVLAEVSAADRKQQEKEMKERTTRLYNQLEEVKQQKAMQERQQIYAQNREKRREFEKKLGKHKKTGSAK